MDRSRIAARVAGLRPTAVNTVLSEVKGVQAEGRTVVSLMRGQPDTPTPEPIVEAACRALKSGRTGYADIQGEPALRQAVAAKLARDNALTYDPASEVLITDGATCGIATALPAARSSLVMRRACSPTRSMMPTARRSDSGAEGRWLYPRRLRGAGSRSNAPRGPIG